MTDACPACADTFRLPDASLCPCVTADAYVDMVTERDDLQEQVNHRDTRLAEAWDKVCENPDVTREGKSLAEATDQALDLAFAQGGEALPAIADALRAYLISQGLPSDPIALDDPALWALVDATL